MSKSSTKILLTGGQGQVGSELRKLCAGREDLIVAAPAAADWDIRDPEQGVRIFEEHQPNVLINCAAYTAVDRAEEESQLAREVNAAAVDTLGALCQRYDCYLIHLSTDFVFGSDTRRPYLPEDATSPAGVYAQTKLEGENLLRDRFGRNGALEGAAIVRTGWVYSVFGKNFPLAILDRARKIAEGSVAGPLRVVEDQVGRPTWAGRIADFLLDRIDGSMGQAAGADRTGEIFHLCNSGVASWYDFAHAVLELGLQNELLSQRPALQPIPATEYPTPASRPAYSVLDLERTRTLYDIPHWRDDLKLFMNQLRANQ